MAESFFVGARRIMWTANNDEKDDGNADDHADDDNTDENTDDNAADDDYVCF